VVARIADGGYPGYVVKRLTLALMATLVLGAAPAEARERCTDGREVAADVRARVYTVKDRWYACARTAAEPLRLAGVRKGALARVAYPYVAVTAAGGKVRLFNVEDRAKAAMRVPGKVTDLVLTYEGVATVIAGGQVLRMNAKGEVVPLDQDATAGSLAANWNGAFVYWTKAGAARSATFTVAPYRERSSYRPPRRCGRSGTQAYVADANAWLLWDSRENELVGCLNKGSKPVPMLIGDDFYNGTIAAPYVGVVMQGFSPYGAGSNIVEVYDLRRFRDEGDYVSYNAHSWVSQLELTNRGVAYILEAGQVDIDGQVVGPPELFRMDQRARVKALDTGDIAIGSLTLTPDGRRVYWTKAGVALTR
jgi:hypothetical protein